MKSLLPRLALVVLAAVALPALAQQWKQVRRDDTVMLSVDIDSIKTENGVTSANYLVDFRRAQEAPMEKHYRSIVVRTRIKCPEKEISVVHTDAYERWGGGGIIVAKTQDSKEDAAFHPLEKDTSDEDVWRYVCEVRKGAPPPKK